MDEVGEQATEPGQYCGYCGTQFDPSAKFCPSCGSQRGVATPAAQQPSMVYVANPTTTRTNQKAIWSLVLSLVALLIWVTAIPGVILGFMARSEIAQRSTETGDGLALAGIIVGFVSGFLGLLILMAVA